MSNALKEVFKSTNKEACCNSANEAGKKLRERFDEAKEEVRDTTAALEKEIRSNPIRSAAVALGVGYLLGKLFR